MFRQAAQKLYRCTAVLLVEQPGVRELCLAGERGVAGWACKAQQREPAGKLTAWTRWVRNVYKDSRGYQHFESEQQPVRKHLPIIGVALVGAGGIYYLSCQEEVPYTHRKHSLVFTSQGQEEYLGKQIFDQVKVEAAAARKLLPDHHPAVRLVRHIGMKIAAVAGDGHGGGNFRHMQNLDWDFVVIKDDTVNAFVVPGGKVVVYTGLMDLMQTEDEIAAVLAHEVAHVLARHQAERISSMSVFSVFQMLLYVSLGITVPGFLYQLAFFLPYSRRAETEADVIGVHLMARACYDPNGNPRMLQKLHHMEHHMEKKNGVSVPGFLRTHPLSTERVKEVEKHLPSAFKELRQSEHCGSQMQKFWGFE